MTENRPFKVWVTIQTTTLPWVNQISMGTFEKYFTRRHAHSPALASIAQSMQFGFGSSSGGIRTSQSVRFSFDPTKRTPRIAKTAIITNMSIKTHIMDLNDRIRPWTSSCSSGNSLTSLKARKSRKSRNMRDIRTTSEPLFSPSLCRTNVKMYLGCE